MSSVPIAKILIVDDEKPQMQALCHTLQDEGYETTGFVSAHQALAALGKQQFDLLLTDLMMPEMDGLHLLQAALKVDPTLAGIMMTGQGTVDTAVQAMKAGALDYILKPFDLTVVRPVLTRALALRRLRIENAALEKQVREHVAELEAANRELEAFSYSVSHDLRAPLRHIDGYTHILMRNASERLSDKDRQTLETIIKSAAHMRELIERLLDLSRLGRQPISKGPVNLYALVNEVLEGLARERERHPVEVRVGELPKCIGDSSLLRQVFTNLLSNAFKFTGNKQNALIEIGHLEKNGQKVYFVRDNGAGFNEDYADTLFRPFHRLHSVEEFEGTGVGLSIVQRIIYRHGGMIWAEGEVDKGAVFYFTIPN